MARGPRPATIRTTALARTIPLTRTLPLGSVVLPRGIGTARSVTDVSTGRTRPVNRPLPVEPPRTSTHDDAGARMLPQVSARVTSTATLLDAAVDWALYREGVRVRITDFDAACRAAREGEGFVWLGLHEPDSRQLALLGEVFDLHPLALEDAANPRQRPKLQRYDESVFLSLRTLAYLEHDSREDGGDIVETGVIIVFVGEHFVVTVRHGRHASMVGLRRRLEADQSQLALGPSAVLHAVADKVVDDYLAVTDAVNEDIEEIENEVFGPRRDCDIERIYQLKRDVIEMKRTVSPLAMPLHELAERPRRLVNPEIREYFRDVADHLARVREQVQSFDELLSSILQAGLARLTVSENEDMRKISAWVAIAAMPTMIAGIYGMNFEHMPELSSQWGYPAVLTGMATVCATMWRGFKRNGWL